MLSGKLSCMRTDLVTEKHRKLFLNYPLVTPYLKHYNNLLPLMAQNKGHLYTYNSIVHTCHKLGTEICEIRQNFKEN